MLFHENALPGAGELLELITYFPEWLEICHNPVSPGSVDGEREEGGDWSFLY